MRDLKYIIILFVILSLIAGLEQWGIQMWQPDVVSWKGVFLINWSFVIYALFSLGIKRLMKTDSNAGFTGFVMLNKGLRMLIFMSALLVYAVIDGSHIFFVAILFFIGYFVSLIIESLYFLKTGVKQQ